MNYETVEIASERLIMKKGSEKDFLKVYEYDFSMLKNVDGVCKLIKQDKEKIEKLFKGGIKKYYSKIKKAHMFDWIIYLEEEPIGNVLTGEESLKEKNIEVSFNIHPSYWGNGYMPESLASIMEYLYTLGYDNIVCAYADGNIKAKRVLDKLGFKPYEIKQDSFTTSNNNLVDEYKVIMTKEEWFSKTGKLSKIKDSL